MLLPKFDHTRIRLLAIALGCFVVVGPAFAQTQPVWKRSPAPENRVPPPSSIRPVQAVEASPYNIQALPRPSAADAELVPAEAAIRLDDLIQAALERNPRIGKATFAVEMAQGKRIQAGLYPNPVLSVTGDELGDRTGPGGIWTAPQFSQEIVTGRKLSLSQAVVAREVDQATLAVLNERFAIIGAVRASFYDVFTLQRRVEILAALVKLAEQSVDTGKKLSEKGAIARLDLIQLEVELERVRTEHEAAEQELPAAFRKLAAIVGDSKLPRRSVHGEFESPVPHYDLQAVADIVRATHPEVRMAKVGVEKWQLALQRARAEPIPNVAITSGYTRQNQNRSSDWMIGFSLPIPVFNRNQGNIRAAQAEIGSAVQEVVRVENDLTERLATSQRIYAAARQRADRYRTAIIPRSEETFKLSSEAFKGGQFEYLRVLQAQRALIEARLEFNRALGDAWKAAGEISGLLLEESWPPRPMEKK